MPLPAFPHSRFLIYNLSSQPTRIGSSSLTMISPSLHLLPPPIWEVATSAASSPSSTVSPIPFPPSSNSYYTPPPLFRTVLSLFARIANIPDVDPTRRMRHRRASSSSSQSSHSALSRDLSARSRSSSRTSMRLSASPRIVATTADKRNSISSLDAFQWSELVSPRKEEHK